MSAETVEVRTVDAVRQTGFLMNFSLADGLEWQPAQSSPVRVATREIVFIQPLDSTPVAPERGVELHLMDGGRLFGAIDSGEQDMLGVDSPLLGRLRIPMERIAAIITEQGRRRLSAGTVASMLRQRGRPMDELWFANGDRLRGSLLSMDRDTVQVSTDSGMADAATDVLLGVFLANPPPATDSSLRATVRLTDTSELGVNDLSWYGQTVQVSGNGWLNASFPSLVLSSVEIVGGRWEWLGTLAPTEYRQQSISGAPWPYRIDSNVLDDAIRIGGVRFRRGVGLHSAASLVYYLGGEYAIFSAMVGVDDSAGPLADADFVVRVDSKPGFEARGLRAGEAPLPVRLDVRGAQRLEIAVEFGRNADIQDRVNVADAAVIRSAAATNHTKQP